MPGEGFASVCPMHIYLKKPSEMPGEGFASVSPSIRCREHDCGPGEEHNDAAEIAHCTSATSAYQPSGIPEEEFSGVGGYFISFHISINSRVATPYNFKSLVTKPGCCPVWLVWVPGLPCGGFLACMASMVCLLLLLAVHQV